MRKILISKIEPGMLLGRTVYSSNGRVLLAGGAELKPEYLKRLQSLGFSAVMVRDSYCRDLVYPEVVSEKTRIAGAALIKEIFEEATKSKTLDTGAVKNLVNQVVDEVVHSRKLLFEVNDVRSYEGYLFAHSLNVCAMSLRIGLQLNYNELQLRDLGVGALLHDIGMMFVERQVSEKMGKLTPAEFEKIKQHCSDGFNLLRERKDISLLSAHVAFQHHERYDGVGYPRLLKKNEICEYARIVSVADMFDALTSETKHRKSYTPAEALEILNNESGRQIDHEIAAHLASNVALFSTGTLVELSSGEVGVVTSNNPGQPLRPKVRVLLDNGKRPVESVSEIDISSVNDLSIVQKIEDEVLCAKVNKLFEG